MAIYKQKGSPFYHIDLRDLNGERIRRSTKTTNKKEAEGIEQELKRRLFLRRHGIMPTVTSPKEKQLPKITLKTFKAEHLEFLAAHLQPKTKEQFQSGINNFERFLNHQKKTLSLTPLNDITVKIVEDWKTWVLTTPRTTPSGKKGTPLTPATLHNYFRTLRTAWARAVKLEYLTENAFQKAGPPPLPKDEDEEGPINFFTKAELAQLFSVVERDSYWYFMIKFFLYSGMRRQEVTNLEWKNLNLKERQIKLPGTKKIVLPKMEYVTRKGIQTFPEQQYLFRTKTGKGRIIPMNQLFVDLILAYQDFSKTCLGLSKCSLIFPAVRTHCQNKPWSKDGITRKFRKTVDRAGLPPNLTLHSLRHTFASDLVQSGHSLYSVGQLLGHTDDEATRIYAHLTPKSQSKVVETLNFEM